MLYILLRVLLMTVFAQTLRYGQSRGGAVWAIVLINYALATLLCLALAAGLEQFGFSRVTLTCGLVGGIAYLVSLVLLLPAMRESGVAVSVAVLQLAVLVPVAHAMLAFGERPSAAQVVGLVLAAGALIVLSLTTSAPGGMERVRFSPLLLPLFFVTGLSGVAMKSFQELGPPRERMSFNTVLFAAATLSTLAAMWRPPRRLVGGRTGCLPSTASFWRKKRGDGGTARPLSGAHPRPAPDRSRRERNLRVVLLAGLVMGTANAGQLIFLMLALAHAPALLVFPVSSALALVANAVVSIYLWGEWLRPAGWLGLGLALGASVLLNLRA